MFLTIINTEFASILFIPVLYQKYKKKILDIYEIFVVGYYHRNRWGCSNSASYNQQGN